MGPSSYPVWVIVVSDLAFAAFCGLIITGIILVLRRDRGKHAQPTAIRYRVFPDQSRMRRESMQLDDDIEAWADVRESVMTEDYITRDMGYDEFISYLRKTGKLGRERPPLRLSMAA